MGKLVRDRIPDLIRASGRIPDIRLLGPEEYRASLHAKLREEGEELAEASDEDFLEELADVYEVVRALAAARGHAMSDVLHVADLKRARRGAFEERIWLEGP